MCFWTQRSIIVNIAMCFHVKKSLIYINTAWTDFEVFFILSPSLYLFLPLSIPASWISFWKVFCLKFTQLASPCPEPRNEAYCLTLNYACVCLLFKTTERGVILVQGDLFKTFTGTSEVLALLIPVPLNFVFVLTWFPFSPFCRQSAGAVLKYLQHVWTSPCDSPFTALQMNSALPSFNICSNVRGTCAIPV